MRLRNYQAPTSTQDRSGAAINSLGQCNELITDNRDTRCGYQLIARKYPSGDAECMSIKLLSGDSLKQGGGAKRKNSDKSQMDNKTSAASCRRAKTKVRRLSLTFLPDRMLTLTFRDNVTECDVAWKQFKYFCKLMKKRYKDRWVYIAVPERQDRGAIHFHLALSGYYSIHVIRDFWRRATGSEHMVNSKGKKVWVSDKTGGEVDITNPEKYNKKSWNPRRIAQYLCKYITKSETVDFNKRRYSCGGRVDIPEPIRGWVTLGIDPMRFLWDVVTTLSRRQPDDQYEVESYFDIAYLST